MNESRTNRRRHTRDNTIAEQDLITGRDARRLVEESWAKFQPVVELMIADAIATHVRETRDRAWWRRLILGVKR